MRFRCVWLRGCHGGGSWCWCDLSCRMHGGGIWIGLSTVVEVELESASERAIVLDEIALSVAVTEAASDVVAMVEASEAARDQRKISEDHVPIFL